MKIKIKNKEYNVSLLDNKASKQVINNLPVKGNLVRWGDEVYILVDFDIPIDKDDGKIFEIGDIIYWKSSKTGNKGIAVFFGNTPSSNKPKANDNCTCKLIGKLETKDFNISDVERGDDIDIN